MELSEAITPVICLLIWSVDAQETFLFIITVENRCAG